LPGSVLDCRACLSSSLLSSLLFSNKAGSRRLRLLRFLGSNFGGSLLCGNNPCSLPVGSLLCGVSLFGSNLSISLLLGSEAGCFLCSLCLLYNHNLLSNLVLSGNACSLLLFSLLLGDLVFGSNTGSLGLFGSLLLGGNTGSLGLLGSLLLSSNMGSPLLCSFCLLSSLPLGSNTGSLRGSPLLCVLGLNSSPVGHILLSNRGLWGNVLLCYHGLLCCLGLAKFRKRPFGTNYYSHGKHDQPHKQQHK